MKTDAPKIASAPEPEEMSGLWRVRAGKKRLFWPRSLGDDLRGRPGYVVDMDHPLEKEWVRGQTYKLEPAPKDATPSPIQHKKALAILREHRGQKPKSASEKVRENGAGGGEKADAPSITPRKR